MRNNFIFNGIIAATLCFITIGGAAAQEYMQQGKAMQVNCENARLARNGKKITAGMDIDLSDLKIKHNQATVFTPMIVNGADTLKLPAVSIYGRTRWYQFERSGIKPIGGKNEVSLRYNQRPDTYSYSQTIAYQSWMNGSELILQRTDYGCGGCEKPVDEFSPLAQYRATTYEPTFRFQEAVAEAVKTRELSGRAFIDFPVNLTTIYPDYRANSVELAKIIATIDSVRNDKDITVKSLSIKGFASPEGPYDNNIRLAKGRTEALKQYVQKLYHFDYGFIRTSYEPEDWEGLREYVATHNIEYQDGILAIIDSYMEPDAKNAKIQKVYPEQYAYLLATVYPALRHSDYRIEYTIRGFNDVNEIAEVMKTHPAKLSLNEMYLLASTKEQGSDEYNEIMETAARIYPKDETALLNAACAAMQRGDMTLAERYLNKADDSAEVFYARGVLAGLQGDYEEAIDLMQRAADHGCQEARSEMQQLKELQKLFK